MITNEKLAELVVQTEHILRAALRPGHIPLNEAQFLSSPVAAMVLQRLIDDYDFGLTRGGELPEGTPSE